MKQYFRIFALGLLVNSCAHSIHQVHVSNFERPAGKKPKIVEATAEQFTVLGFVFETDYVNKAIKELESRCEAGLVDGITTKYSTSLGFFSWTNRITVRGVCHS